MREKQLFPGILKYMLVMGKLVLSKIVMEASGVGGGNGNGSLGNGSTASAEIHYAAQVKTDASTNLTGAVAGAMFSYSNHMCVVMSDTGLKCWGNGGNGQLGSNAKSSSGYAVDVVNNSDTPITGFTDTSIGLYSACGLKSDGSLLCWGKNSYSSLGDGRTLSITAPTPVSGM